MFSQFILHKSMQNTTFVILQEKIKTEKTVCDLQYNTKKENKILKKNLPLKNINLCVRLNQDSQQPSKINMMATFFYVYLNI